MRARPWTSGLTNTWKLSFLTFVRFDRVMNLGSSFLRCIALCLETSCSTAVLEYGARDQQQLCRWGQVRVAFDRCHTHCRIWLCTALKQAEGCQEAYNGCLPLERVGHGLQPIHGLLSLVEGGPERDAPRHVGSVPCQPEAHYYASQG